jgi:hypothetical protein
MAGYDDRLKDYVEVKDRIKLFYELYGQGRLVTGEVRLTSEPDGVPRVLVQAFAYRSPDDGHPGVGHSWLELPGKTPYTKGSEVENAETSAWGRAIGALGILIDRSIASAQEVQNKQDDGLTGVQSQREASTETDGLVGLSVTQGNQDGELRITPDGAVLPFRVKDGGQSFIVVAEGQIAETLGALRGTWMGSRVTVWGHWTDEVIPAKGTKPEIKYRILHLERIQTPEFTLPAPAKPEAPSVQMFEGME